MHFTFVFPVGEIEEEIFLGHARTVAAGRGPISFALRADVDDWLHHYNYERPHLGYRNMGNRPFEAINEYRQVLGKKPKCTLDG